MLVRNNSTVRPYTLGSISIAPLQSVEVSTEWADDIALITDLQILSGQVGDGRYQPIVNANMQLDADNNVLGLMGGDGVAIAASEFIADPVSNPDRSILVIGGDHPYAQWWGTDGKDGMAAMYLDLNIKPYLAICANDASNGTAGAEATPSQSGMMTIEQCQYMQSKGVEFVNHGTRHASMWDLWNTGIRVWYTGVEASPTVNITTTNLVLNTATAGTTNLSLTTYATISALKTAIASVSGWNCQIATELIGDEPSNKLMPLNAARSVVTIGAGDITNSNQRFALCGGIVIRYTGSAYKNVTVALNDGSNFLSIFVDGARILVTSTAVTLMALATTVNNLAIAGLSALVMDNSYNAQTISGSTTSNPGQKFRETYCFGDELASGLHRIPVCKSINFTGIQMCGGVGLAYALRRQVLHVREKAIADYGLTIDSFAQSGGRFYPWQNSSLADEQVAWRGNSNYSELASQVSPYAMPMGNKSSFHGHFTSFSPAASIPYSEDDVKAIIDALADSSGWMVTWLNHLLTPTPLDPSPYTGLNQNPLYYAGSADQDEGDFYRELVHAASARDAYKIDILTPTKAIRAKQHKSKPRNLIFNAKFRNGRAGNLLGITTLAQGSTGVACPNWRIASSSSDYSSFSVINESLTLVTNGAIASGKIPISTALFLEAGKTYRIGASLNLLGLEVNSQVTWIIRPMQNGMGEAHPLGLSYLNSGQYFGGTSGDANFLFTVPPRGNPSPARAISIAGAFSFTVGDAILIAVDGRSNSAAIVLTGLTTAKAVANAINAQMAIDATYVSLAQYHNIARAYDNKVIIESPDVNGFTDAGGSQLTITNSVGTPLVTLFGAGVTSVRAQSSANDILDTTFLGYELALSLGSTTGNGTIKVQAPYCRELEV